MGDVTKKARGRPKLTDQQKQKKKSAFLGTALITHIEKIKEIMSNEQKSQLVTYRFPHREDFSRLFASAQSVADYAVLNKRRKGKLSSAEVSQYGLPSAISNQILRKYSNKTIKRANNVNIIIPGQSVSYNDNTISIPCLDLKRRFCTGRQISKINQVELTSTVMFISVTIDVSREQFTPSSAIGIDLNCTHHVLVAADINTGKVYKVGKQIPSIRKKYFKKRQRAQLEDTDQVRIMGNRESYSYHKGY